jgi:hypothetical protein
VQPLQNGIKRFLAGASDPRIPALTEVLKKYVGERTSGFLFQNKNGNSLSQTNLLRSGLHPALKKLGHPKAGFHAFRRFRTTWVRKNRTPEDLIRFWLGHADEAVTDGYSKLREGVQYRREVANKIGLGFEISGQASNLVPNVHTLQPAAVQRNTAQRYESRGEIMVRARGFEPPAS